ncbi:MAG: ABC transporter ATP-binding protein [Paraclostridium sp.]
MEKIKLENLNKSFGNNTILKNINLSIKNGEIVAILGRSGSGKSTLLNILGGLTSADSGNYSIDGKILNLDSLKELENLRKDKISFILQNYALIKDLNVYENINLGIKYSKNKNISQNKIDDILKKLNILDKKYKLPKYLSGGECQRVAIARAMLRDSEILLADEPSGALDECNESIIMDIFLELAHKGKTILLVTHNIDLAKRCTRIVEIKDGIIINKNLD